ncbi:Thiamin diphosphate-binding protein [Sistotremastrum suecicum HHB10207 ss-3]|uniref:Thiamin diphosphate-binding protein n=1 Tax=Sistotremastrum suecicum HHB10207 ss-3 TaxID=1314776 RepID=A0A166HZG4_9AGAM|nr:Thiamin diphosphate-binding protein [Sistotremastrum suecicum HHB10207 ss-3]
MFTTSSAFLKTLRESGITHAFVNWGSDHPALLEDIERQRVEDSANAGPKIITCPNEMVALSAAQGYAQVTGRPAAVLVHVDVGTQALAGAIHNVSRGRIPVLIYAGASPFTTQGELKGSRNEFIFWLQGYIVRQYMRHTSQINSGTNVAEVVLRSLQFAKSDPKGPVYLWARREVMEEDLSEEKYKKSLDLRKWAPIEPSSISEKAANLIAVGLISAKKPLIITSYLGREPSAVSLLVALSDLLAIPVFTSCPTTLSFPHNHQNFVDLSYGMGENTWLREADFVLVIDSDIPWVPMNNRPRDDAEIFHIDVDVLKENMGSFQIPATRRWKADATLALEAILNQLNGLWTTMSAEARGLVQKRDQELLLHHSKLQKSLDAAEVDFPQDGTFTTPNLIAVLRTTLPPQTLFLNEGISNYPLVWSHLRSTRVGSIITSGGSNLGWGLGAAIGAYIGQEVDKDSPRTGTEGNDFICLVVGDGSFLFGAPSSGYWMAKRYSTPFLTIILNNGGWKSPMLSMLSVHPNGLGSVATGQQLNVSFGPDAPDYAGIASAAGGAWGKKVTRASELRESISEAIRVVREEKRCAVLDCIIQSF